MTTVTVTPLQAQYLAGLLDEAKRAHRVASEAVSLVTLGHVPPHAVLTNIDVDTGTLSFSVTEVTPSAD